MEIKTENPEITFVVLDKGQRRYFDNVIERHVVGTKFIFLFKVDKRSIGVWSATVSDGLALTEGLIVSEKWRGKGYGEQIVITVLKYLYETFGVREVHSTVSENKRVTLSFSTSRNLLIKLGYELKMIVRVEDASWPEPFYELALIEKNYKKIINNEIRKLSREQTEKIWQEQLKSAKEKFYKKR